MGGMKADLGTRCSCNEVA